MFKSPGYHSEHMNQGNENREAMINIDLHEMPGFNSPTQSTKRATTVQCIPLGRRTQQSIRVLFILLTPVFDLTSTDTCPMIRASFNVKHRV